MTVYEIVSLIIAIFSLFATITISLVIYIFNNKQKSADEYETIQHEARTFIAENAEERDFLHLCIIAAGCFPQNKHVRKIYNEFSLLRDKVKVEVLNQANLNIGLINSDEWINEKIKMIISAAKELDVGQTFLYDGAKYFFGMYKVKKKQYLKYDTKNFSDLKYVNISSCKKTSPISFTDYLHTYLHYKFKNDQSFSHEWIKPFDYMINIEGIRKTNDICLVYYWVGIIIESIILYSDNYTQYKNEVPFYTDAIMKTFEDRYFDLLFSLYFFNKKQSTTE